MAMSTLVLFFISSKNVRKTLKVPLCMYSNVLTRHTLYAYYVLQETYDFSVVEDFETISVCSALQILAVKIQFYSHQKYYQQY